MPGAEVEDVVQPYLAEVERHGREIGHDDVRGTDVLDGGVEDCGEDPGLVPSGGDGLDQPALLTLPWRERPGRGSSSRRTRFPE